MVTTPHSDTFSQIAALPERSQSVLLQRMIDENLRGNPVALTAALHDTLRQHAIEPKRELEQQVELASSITTAHAEVKQALQRGESVENVKAQAVSSGNVAQAAVVATAAQEHKEEERREQVAVADEVHRERVGLSAPEQAAHPLHHLVKGELASIGAAMGGPQQAHDTTEVAMVSGGKDTQRGPVNGRG